MNTGDEIERRDHCGNMELDKILQTASRNAKMNIGISKKRKINSHSDKNTDSKKQKKTGLNRQPVIAFNASRNMKSQTGQLTILFESATESQKTEEKHADALFGQNRDPNTKGTTSTSTINIRNECISSTPRSAQPLVLEGPSDEKSHEVSVFSQELKCQKTLPPAPNQQVLYTDTPVKKKKTQNGHQTKKNVKHLV